MYKQSLINMFKPKARKKHFFFKLCTSRHQSPIVFFIVSYVPNVYTSPLLFFLLFLMFPNVSISKESEKTFVKVCTSRCNTLILVYLSCNRLGDEGLGLCTFSNSSFSVRKVDPCRPDRKVHSFILI